MHSNLNSSLIRLQDWVDKVLSEGKKCEPNIEDFISSHDLYGLKKFYDELVPFVCALEQELPQTKSLVDKYKALLEQLKKELERREKRFWLDNIFDPLTKNRIDKLLLTLEDIKSNLGNIIYQIKINSN
jgi:hypothetical protein